MKLLVGLFIAGLLVTEGYGLTRRIFRKCQESGVTFPTCEAGERLGYFKNTCDEVVSGNFGKFRFLQIQSGSFRSHQVLSDPFRFLQGSSDSFRLLQSSSGDLRCLKVP